MTQPMENDVCRFHSGFGADIKTMKDSINAIELKLDRPPVWLSFVFAGMSFMLGAAITWIVHLHSVANLKGL